MQFKIKNLLRYKTICSKFLLILLILIILKDINLTSIKNYFFFYIPIKVNN